MAKLDQLTGLLHGQNLEHRLDGLLDSADDSGEPVSLIIADLGGLKNINNLYGFEAGDIALKAVAVLIPAAMPETALCYRLGGDAFVVVLPGLGAGEALECAAHLQEAMRTSRIEVRPGEHITMRAFTGVATYPGEGNSGRGLVRTADRRMHAARSSEGVA